MVMDDTENMDQSLQTLEMVLVEFDGKIETHETVVIYVNFIAIFYCFQDNEVFRIPEITAC